MRVRFWIVLESQSTSSTFCPTHFQNVLVTNWLLALFGNLLESKPTSSTFCPTHFQNVLVTNWLLALFGNVLESQSTSSTFCPTHFQNELVTSWLLAHFANVRLYTPMPAIFDTSLLSSVSRHICASLGSRSAAACFLFLLQHACVH
jgi:RNA polymerase subunit RPABC4/transcription elongation factor Spt4